MTPAPSRPKIVILTVPSGFPSGGTFPLGVSRVIEGLDPSLNCEVEYIDLEHTHLSFEEIKARLAAAPPQIIGFSAILTHAYSHVKDLSRFLKEHFPRSTQVLGGQMAVISNLLLQRTGIDFCVVGDADPAFSGLIRKLIDVKFDLADPKVFLEIRGLAFNLEGAPYFTGYTEPTKTGLLQLNYGLMSRFLDIGRFFPEITAGFLTRSINKHEIGGYYELFHKENLNKQVAQVSASKGCSGRCTFCNRFYKGYSAIDPHAVIGHIEALVEKRGIGLIEFFGEHFGADKAKTEALLAYLKQRRLNWTASSRVTPLDAAMLAKWKASGCVFISFGIESCSRKILDVMEKRATVADNLNAINLCFKSGICTVILLLIGMPGETEDTIQETISNLIKTIPDDITMPYEIVVNYFQAVPGTAGYEYARNVGLIGASLDEEERYIAGLYGVDANKIKHYLNFTDYEKEETAYWENYIFLELIVGYIKKHGLFRTLKHKKANRYKYAAIYMLLPAGARRFLLKYFTIIASFGSIAFMRVAYRKLFKRKTRFFSLVAQSLREINKKIALPVRPDDIHTHVLRMGR